MSSFLRKLLTTPPPEARTEVVEFRDPDSGEAASVLLRAYDDAERIVTDIALDEAHLMALAASYTATLRLRGVADAEVSPSMVPFVRMVHRCIVTPDGEAPLDESDVAYLAKRHGGVFIMLMNAAGKLTNVENLAEQFMDAAAGKSSPDSEPSPSRSGSGPTERRAKSPRR